VLFADSVALALSASLDVQEYASLTPPSQGSLSTKITAPPAQLKQSSSPPEPPGKDPQ
jgi:hypothetical protein